MFEGLRQNFTSIIAVHIQKFYKMYKYSVRFGFIGEIATRCILFFRYSFIFYIPQFFAENNLKPFELATINQATEKIKSKLDAKNRKYVFFLERGGGLMYFQYGDPCQYFWSIVWCDLFMTEEFSINVVLHRNPKTR